MTSNGGHVTTEEGQWQRPAEIPAPAAEVEPEAPVRVPHGLRPKDRPLESQATIPLWPKRGIFVDSDNHFPIADPLVTAAKLAFVRDMKPSLWLNLGDLIDDWLASRFEKEASRLFGGYGARLQEEIDSARPYVEAVCSIVEQAHWIPGNHEHRQERLIDANPSLHGLRALGWREIFQFPANFIAHPYGARLRVNRLPLYAVHGDQIVPERVVAPAQYMLQKRVNQTTLFGHTHKAAEAYRTGYDENREPIIYGAINTGHGSLTVEQRYAGPEPDWQHAFAWIDCYEVDGKARFSTHLIKIIDGRFSWGGTLYDGRKCQ
jgi:predicted phosphodiesterase